MYDPRSGDGTAPNSRYRLVFDGGFRRSAGVTRSIPVNEIVVPRDILFLRERTGRILIIGFVVKTATDLGFLSEVSETFVWTEKTAEAFEAWFGG